MLFLHISSNIMSLSASPYLWGKRALELVNLQHEGVTSLYTRPGPQEVLEQLNPSTLTRSAVKFPIRRMLSVRGCLLVPFHVKKCSSADASG